MVSNKIFIVAIIAVSIIATFAVCVAANIGGLGTMLAGTGGSTAKGFYKIGLAPVSWAASGGWPTLTVFYLLGLLFIPLCVAYAVWHYDLPYKISRQGSNAGNGSYQSQPQQNIIPLDNQQNSPSK